jgi:hypothetical protein
LMLRLRVVAYRLLSLTGDSGPRSVREAWCIYGTGIGMHPQHQWMWHMCR